MKIKSIGFLALALTAVGFVACIDDENTDEAIFERDLKDIEEYVAESDMVNVKEFIDPVTGISIIWQEVSASGLAITRGDTISTDYTGRFLNDAIFDTSIDSVARANSLFDPRRSYVPLRFRTSSSTSRLLVVSGFEYGLVQLEQGDKATILIPSAYAYGNNPPPNSRIPLNAPLIFEVELTEVKAGPPQ
jgi:FKBP-type peptidyl-prolyl cis-trans isomerase FkpA